MRIGMSTALSGPLEKMGQDMKDGIEAYFSRINQTGGIKGRQLRLIVKDDGYEPHRAAQNMRYLIDNENVIAVIGNVGTPTAIVTLPIAIEKQTLLFGALTGAKLLRQKPYSPYVINYRASYEEEAKSMIEGLLSSGLEPEKIAFFTQRDGYGNAGYTAATQALHKHGFRDTELLAHGRYTRNTLNVEEAVATILDAQIEPKAVIMAGSYEASAKFIKLVKKIIPDMIFVNYSFVGSIALKETLGDLANGIIITQVVPNYNSHMPIKYGFYSDLWVYKHRVKPSFVLFEGYVIAKIFVEALKNIQGDINKENIITEIQNLNDVDIGLGINIGYGENKNQAMYKIWPMIIKDGLFKSHDWNELGTNAVRSSLSMLEQVKK